MPDFARNVVNGGPVEISFQQFVILEREKLNLDQEVLSRSEYFMFDIQGRLIKSYSNFAELSSGYFLNDLNVSPVIVSKVSTSTGLVESFMIVNN